LVDITAIHLYQSSHNLKDPEDGRTVQASEQGKPIEINKVAQLFLRFQEDPRGYVVAVAFKQLQRKQFCAIQKAPFSWIPQYREDYSRKDVSWRSGKGWVRRALTCWEFR